LYTAQCHWGAWGGVASKLGYRKMQKVQMTSIIIHERILFIFVLIFWRDLGWVTVSRQVNRKLS